MDILIIVLTVIDALVALLLIAVVLIQQPKDSGFGGAPFGGTGDSVFGAHAADHITKITVGLAATFLLLTLGLAIITGHSRDNGQGLLEAAASAKTEPAITVPKTKPSKQTEVEKTLSVTGAAQKADKTVKIVTDAAAGKAEKAQGAVKKKAAEAEKKAAEIPAVPKSDKQK